MRQTWYDLLFAHWRVPASVLRDAIPPSLEIDEFDGSAWIGVVPFGMEEISLRPLPPLPGTSRFLELNVRTYVRPVDPALADKPGVWFFSLDAANRLAVEVARRWFHLPYFYAQMLATRRAGELLYESTRTHTGAPAASLNCKYAPTGDVYHSTRGDLDHWLTERYCLYSSNRTGGLHRGEIHHAQWPLQPARAEFIRNSMAAPFLGSAPAPPETLHFARSIDVLIWPLTQIS